MNAPTLERSEGSEIVNMLSRPSNGDKEGRERALGKEINAGKKESTTASGNEKAKSSKK